MKKALLMISPGFEEVEAITPWDFLRRAGIEVFAAGIGSDKITGAHGISLDCDGTVHGVTGDWDVVVIPGGMPGATNIAESPKAMEIIQQQHDRGALIAAICASPGVVLGKTHILEDRRATSYPSFEKLFPSSTVASEERVVVDGHVITSRGPGTAAEFAISIIRYLEGDEMADKIDQSTLQK